MSLTGTLNKTLLQMKLFTHYKILYKGIHICSFCFFVVFFTEKKTSNIHYCFDIFFTAKWDQHKVM